MKNIYELLNEIDINENEIEEMEVSDSETAKIKNGLKQKISKNAKANKWKRNGLIASVIFGLSMATVGITYPSYAGNIPIIKDIFRFFNDEDNEDVDNGKTGLYANYKQYANEINIMRESDGTKITIVDAIYDGKTVTLTYSIESDKDLGQYPIMDMPQIKNVHALAGTDGVKKVDKHKYIGMLTASSMEEQKNEAIHVRWKIDRIESPDINKEIKGNWDFNFTLEATESKLKLINKSVENGAVKVSIEKLSLSPMSFIVYYKQEVSKKIRDKWGEVLLDLKIKDDLGNEYSGQGNGGKGSGLNMNLSKTFGMINQKATKLIVTPVIMNDVNKKLSPTNIVLDDIVIDLK